jgi:hypothetical protein
MRQNRVKNSLRANSLERSLTVGDSMVDEEG